MAENQGSGLKMGTPKAASFAELAGDVQLGGNSNMGTFDADIEADTTDEGAGIEQQTKVETTTTTTDTQENAGAEGGENSENTQTGDTGEGDKSTGLPEGITPETMKAFLAAQGIEWDGNLDTLKAALTANKPQASPEELQRQAEDFERRVVTNYVNSMGGKAEDYVSLKAIANTKPADLALAEIRRELTSEGFTPDQTEAILKDRYFQFTDEEIEEYETDEEKEYIRKKRAYGAKALEHRALPIIDKAKSVLDELNNAVKAQDLLAQTEATLSSKVDDVLGKLPKKITFQLGEQNGHVIDPIEFDVDDTHIAEVREMLKNPAKRDQIFLNPDNSLNIEKVSNLLLRNAYLEKALKKAYLTAETRNTEILKSVFPHTNANAVGVGASGSNGTGVGSKNGVGKMKSFGKSTLVKRQ